MAKYLEENGLVRRIGRNLIHLVVTLKRGLKSPVVELVRYWKSSGLLPPLDFYTPFNYPLPYWMLRSYERKSA